MIAAREEWRATIACKVPRETKEDLRRLAEAADKTLSEYCMEVLQAHVIQSLKKTDLPS